MVQNLRASILKGFAAANRIHHKYNLSKIDDLGSTYLDVYDIIQKEKVFLYFAPLENMHGAYLPNNKEGIIINSKHPVHVQRFTAAHELGHHVLGHKPSIDIQILGRAPLPSDKYENNGSDPEQEKEADSFASAFLMPKWLIGKHLMRMGVTQDYLKNDINIYQMSLRLGVSYKAFCWCLFGHEILTYNEAEKLSNSSPKDIKLKIVSEETLKLNPWANVWIVDKNSSNLQMLGEKSDLFVFSLEESPSTGYIWDFSHLSEHGLRLISEYVDPNAKQIYGSEIKRKFIFTNDDLLKKEISLYEKRPWNKDIINSIKLNLAMTGRGKGFYKKVHLSNAA